MLIFFVSELIVCSLRFNHTYNEMPTVHLLDYVAGNIRSLVNAIEKVGYQVEWIKSPEDVQKAEVLPLQPHQRVFPTALGTDMTDRLPRNSSSPE